MAWSKGDHYALARRASLEDDLAALGEVDGGLVLDELRAAGDDDLVDLVEQTIRALQRVAGNRVTLLRECRELDDRFGLTAKGMAALRWKIVEDEVEAKRQARSEGERKPGRRLKAVDPSAVAGA